MSSHDDRRKEWEAMLHELENRRALARRMGGPERVEKHNRGGRLDARKRIDALVDKGTFVELGTLVGGISRGDIPAAADALVAGMAKIDGRPVLVGSEDFTVMGGSIGLGTHAKRLRLALLAGQERVPLVMILEGGGERPTNALQRHPYAPNDLEALADLAGQVPTVAVVLGPSAGHGALTAMLMDFVIMSRDAVFFSAGPVLVEGAIGEKVSKEELGGPDVHVRESGVVHNCAEDDREALDLVRRYLSYLPSNAWQRPPQILPADNGRRSLDGILDFVPLNPNTPYDMRCLVDMLADAGSVLEIQPDFGASVITSLARLGGRTVAVVANQPLVMAGTIDYKAGNKAAHFLEVADAFHLPVLFLTDNPGIMAGTAAERSGAIRSASRMYYAQARLRSPKLHVTVRKAYGFGSCLMAMNPFDRQTITLAFPGASLAAMPADGGGSASHADLETREALKTAEFGGAWDAGDTLAFDEIIDPRELRNVLLSALELSAGRETEDVGPRPGGIRP